MFRSDRKADCDGAVCNSAVLEKLTMGEGTEVIHGKLVELRLIPLIVIGGLALRTVLARQAEKIQKGNRAVSY